MEQSVESNSFEKFKAITSLPTRTWSIFQIFFRKDFPENPVNLDIGNLVLITSTFQVKLSKFNFNFGLTSTLG